MQRAGGALLQGMCQAKGAALGAGVKPSGKAHRNRLASQFFRENPRKDFSQSDGKAPFEGLAENGFRQLPARSLRYEGTTTEHGWLRAQMRSVPEPEMRVGCLDRPAQAHGDNSTGSMVVSLSVISPFKAPMYEKY